jgi:hypothetical protein
MLRWPGWKRVARSCSGGDRLPGGGSSSLGSSILGASHNRFQVGDVVAPILSSIDDAGTAQLAAESIRADPGHAGWFAGYVDGVAVMSPIATAFADIRGGDDEASSDDSPF